MNRDEFQQQIKSAFTDFSAIFFQQIERYRNFLQAYNQHTNLTRLATDDKIYGDYFYDSIIPYQKVQFKTTNSLLDIGSGSGIPGVVLLLLYPHLQLTIIESNRKKVKFLFALMDELKINFQILPIRAELIPDDLRDTFDLVTSRAVAPLKIILELSAPYCKVGGLIIEPKSQNAPNELNEAAPIIEALNIKLLDTLNFCSANNHTHHVFIFQKELITNRKYPRK
jgi:16S rRNA (guanine527-N7)-methyltransferase